MSEKKSKRRKKESCCPVCGSRQTGQVGNKQFFCWSCLVEYNNCQEAFAVTEEGTLVAFRLSGGENSVV